MLLGSGLVPQAANAADPTEALIRKGVDKRRKNDNQGALPLFREAYETSRKPRAAAQLGLCEQALEMWLDAEAHISEALLSQTDAWVSGQRGTLESALEQARKHLARVEVADAPAGASVTINGVFRGKVEDAPFFVEPGAMEVAITSGQESSRTKIAAVAAAETRVVKFEHEPTKMGPAAEVASNIASASPDTTVNGVSATAIVPESGNGLRVARWVSLGTGSVALAFGTYALVQRNGAANDFNNYKTDTGDKACFLSDGKVVGPTGGQAAGECNDLDDRVSSKATAATIGFVAGAALITAGITLWLLEPRAERTGQAFVCAPNFGSAGLSCGSTF